MKRNIILLILLSVSFIASTRMPDIIKAARYFNAESGSEVDQPKRFDCITPEELAQLNEECPDLDLTHVRFYSNQNGTIKVYKYKIDRTQIERKFDYADIAMQTVLNRHNRETSVYHIISPIFYYSNDFDDVKKQSFTNINSKKFKSIALSLFGGYFVTCIGINAIRSIMHSKFHSSSLRHPDISTAIPASIALTTMIYKMHADQAALYLKITEDEYLELRKLYPEIDCDDLLITHPIKNQFLKIVKYFGISFVIAAVIHALRYYSSICSSQNYEPQVVGRIL